MTENSTERFYTIVGALFEVDPATLNDTSSQESIERWDSLGMVNLISELEAAFAIDFDLLEIAEFKNLGAVKESLRAKGIALD